VRKPEAHYTQGIYAFPQSSVIFVNKTQALE